MDSILNAAIQSVQTAGISFCKYIAANDTKATKSHQYGYHIAKDAWPLFFDKPAVKGDIKERKVTIKWQGDFETASRFVYYGQKTRNEYRLTQFGRHFPFREDDNIGDLLIISYRGNDYYEAFILQSDDDIDDFLNAFNISNSDINGIIPKQFELSSQDQLHKCFSAFINQLTVEFPTTLELSSNARTCYNSSYKVTDRIIKSFPDREIIKWLDAEFQLFKMIENDRYKSRIQIPFLTVEEFIDTANTILNRRKSRAGKSLEHHLAEIFGVSGLKFSTQEMTEDKKKPDFIFPGVEAYLNPKFNADKLAILASKTTCKDRWRQVINEADRVKTKHLFTLQQGISSNQLSEMYKYNVCLVVPEQNISSFPEQFKGDILSLEKFITHVQNIQQ